MNVVEYLKKHHGSPDSRFDVFFDPVGTPALYTNSPYYTASGTEYLDLFGGMHFDSISAITGSIFHLAKALALPAKLGGTDRTFKPLMLKAQNMVRKFRFFLDEMLILSPA